MILTVARLKDDYTQEEIGNKIGWSRGKVNQYTTILNKIDTGVSIDFTEYWFRTSGIYDLNKDNQLKFMNWFIDNKCNVNKKKQATLNLIMGYKTSQRIKKLMNYCLNSSWMTNI